MRGGPRLIAGALLVGILVLSGAVGPLLLAPAARGEIGAQSLEPPSRSHLLGTDNLGMDVLERLLLGARTSLLVACLAVLGATLIGASAGLGAGLLGGLADTAVMRTVDYASAFPQVMLVIFLSTLWGEGSVPVVVAIIAATTWMSTARLVRAEVLSLRETELLAAAVASGASRLRAALAHLLPNVMGVVIVAATLRVGNAILLETSLGFLGLGLPEETPTWGRMILDGWRQLRSAWWIATFPGIAITLATVGFNLLGDGLGDAQRIRRRRG
ncbi:MAG: ABC transporter permease [Acidobacteriota bacterium]|nr:ABC transporter permease [Acidobacteriota bacterium]